MRFNTLILATLALEVALAQPAHRHAHHHKLGLRDVLGKRWGTPPNGWDDKNLYSGVDFTKAYEDGVKGKGQGQGDQGHSDQHATPTTSPSETAGSSESTPTSQSSSQSSAQSSSQDSSQGSPHGSSPSSNGASSSSSSSGSSNNGDSSSCSDLKDLGWEGGKAKRAKLEEDTYVGNTGGGDYASNIKPEPNCEPSLDHSLTFVNHMGSEKKFWIWNKIGADGKSMNGMMSKAKEFTLQNGQKAVFSIERNSQLGFSLAVGRAASNGGVPNGNIGELNIDDQLSHGGSAYDVSMVTLNDIKATGGSPIEYPLKISAPGYSLSSNSNCVYDEKSQNAPVKPGADGKCAIGPVDGSPFHVTAVFG